MDWVTAMTVCLAYGVVLVFWLDVFFAQLALDLEADDARLHTLTILALRSSTIVPCLASGFLLLVFLPGAYPVVMIAMSVVEAYSLRCFYVMVLAFFGGRAGSSAALKRRYGADVTRLVEIALWLFVYVRPPLEAVVFTMLRVTTLGYLFAVLSSYAIATMSLVALVTLVVGVRRDAEALLVERKFITVKLVVFVVLAENMIRLLTCYVDHRDRRLVYEPGRCPSRFYIRVVVYQLAFLAAFFPFSFRPPIAYSPTLPRNDLADSRGTPATFLADFLAVCVTLPFESPGIVGHRDGFLGLLAQPVLAAEDDSVKASFI